MNLNNILVLASVRKAGQGSYVITPEQSFKIETSPQGEDILDVSPPPGKKWTINLKVNIEESDV